jgi:hypothetical protein
MNEGVREWGVCSIFAAAVDNAPAGFACKAGCPELGLHAVCWAVWLADL